MSQLNVKKLKAAALLLKLLDTEKMCEGQRVWVLWLSKTSMCFYPGCISSCLSGGERFLVNYDDGDVRVEWHGYVFAAGLAARFRFSNFKKKRVKADMSKYITERATKCGPRI